MIPGPEPGDHAAGIDAYDGGLHHRPVPIVPTKIDISGTTDRLASSKPTVA